MSASTIASKQPDDDSTAPPEPEGASVFTPTEGESAHQPDNVDTGRSGKLTQQIGPHAWGQVLTGFRQVQESRISRYRSGDHKPPRFSRASFEERIAKSYDVGRIARQEYDELTTVWLSLVVPEKESGEWRNPETHAEHFDVVQSGGTVYRNLYRTLKPYDYAGIRLMAPRETGYTHLHIGLWIDGDVTAEDFHSVVDSFNRNTPATAEDNPHDKAITVRTPTRQDYWETPEGTDTETANERGYTTGLPREIAANMHAAGTETGVFDTDDRDAHPSGEVLHAALAFEIDMRTWQPFGEFAALAEKGREERTAHQPDNVDTKQDVPSPKPDNPDSTQSPPSNPHTQQAQSTDNRASGSGNSSGKTVIDTPTKRPGSLGIG